jgi:hypothetical protein
MAAVPVISAVIENSRKSWTPGKNDKRRAR